MMNKEVFCEDEACRCGVYGYHRKFLVWNYKDIFCVVSHNTSNLFEELCKCCGMSKTYLKDGEPVCESEVTFSYHCAKNQPQMKNFSKPFSFFNRFG